MVFISLNRTGNYQIVFLCKYRITCKGDEETHCSIIFHQCNMNVLLMFVEKVALINLKQLFVSKMGNVSLDVEICICVVLHDTLDNFGFLCGGVFWVLGGFCCCF